MIKEHVKQLKTDIQLLFSAAYVIIEVQTALLCPRIYSLLRSELISLNKERMFCMIEDVTKYGIYWYPK